MWLEQVTVRSFRAYREADLVLPANGLGMIIGANNSGKSALLSAMDVLAGGGGGPTWIYGIDEEATVEGLFALTNDERAALIQQMSGGMSPAPWLDTEAFSHLKWVFKQTRQLSAPINSELLVSINSGELSAIARKRQPQDARMFYENLPQTLANSLTDRPFACGVELNGISQDSSVDSTISMFQPFRQLLNQWRRGVYHFRALRAGTQPVRPSQGATDLVPSGDNLPECLLWLQTNDGRKWQEVSRIMRELVPGVGTLYTPVMGGSVSVVFEGEAGYRVNLKDLGTGVEQLMLTVYVGVVHAGAKLVIIEEPETNLHPEAQRWLLNYLAAWSRSRQLLMATHSPVFLNRADDLGAAVWVVERHPGGSVVRPADQDLADALRILGVRLGDVLSAEGLLLVEGPSDEEAIQEWFGSKLHENRVTVVDMGGGDGAWRIDQLADWLEQGNTLTPKVLCIRDRDELDDGAVERLTTRGVIVLRKRELENYLLDAGAISAEIRTRRNAEGLDPASWTEEYTKEALRAAADKVQPVVALKRVAQALGALRPLSRADVAELAKAGVLSVDSVDERIKANWDAAKTVRALWEREERAVKGLWEAHWQDLASGSDMLAIVWRQAGLSYDKGRDTPRLAALIDPPKELATVIDHFVARLGA